MRALTTFAVTLMLCFLLLNAASAQVLLAANNSSAPAAPLGGTMVLTGRVASPAGPLVGAVVSVAGKTYQKAVTNIDGEFRLTVPASSEALDVTASYAGYRDVTATLQYGTTPPVMQLTEVEEIKVSRKQSLTKYIKLAHKQAKRESREIHRD